MAKVAVGATFATNGLAFGGWLARAPAVRDDLSLSVAGFGLLLLCISAAAITAIPLAGPLVQRVGPARAILLGSGAMALGLAGLGTGTLTGSVSVAAAGLVLVGAGNSTWDVAMNVEGADVERHLGRTLMPRFHAGFSLGTVLGAGLSALAAAAGLPIWVQLYLTAALTAGATIPTVRAFLPYTPLPPGEKHPMSVLEAWREPRTVLIGLIMLGFGFTEGVANDWLAISLVDAYGASETVGAIGYGTFVTAMTLSRFFGGTAIERWGRVRVLRGTVVLGVVGLTLVVAQIGVPAVLVGALLWGAGASLGFPHRHELSGRRPDEIRDPRVGGGLDRVRGFPGRPATDRRAGPQLRRPERAALRVRGVGHRLAGIRRRQAAAHPIARVTPYIPGRYRGLGPGMRVGALNG
ncbi:MFS transporter [Paractinoplanes rishiriensis]|uniref:MFS transporter n=1 Tax=Paractinoplanes rishiriensis TaxID=1050105 RepID=UPI001EF3B17E|nr:MFS transporter [Actinoplanes rishiriensis]